MFAKRGWLECNRVDTSQSAFQFLTGSARRRRRRSILEFAADKPACGMMPVLPLAVQLLPDMQVKHCLLCYLSTPELVSEVTANVVNHPTQLICISYLYLSTNMQCKGVVARQANNATVNH